MPTPPIGNNLAKPLRSVVERIEKLAEEKAGIASDINDIYKEAKGNGLDVKSIREAVRLRKMNADERAEREYYRDLYLTALGLIDSAE